MKSKLFKLALLTVISSVISIPTVTTVAWGDQGTLLIKCEIAGIFNSESTTHEIYKQKDEEMKVITNGEESSFFLYGEVGEMQYNTINGKIRSKEIAGIVKGESQKFTSIKQFQPSAVEEIALKVAPYFYGKHEEEEFALLYQSVFRMFNMENAHAMKTIVIAKTSNYEKSKTSFLTFQGEDGKDLEPSFIFMEVIDEDSEEGEPDRSLMPCFQQQ